jgi:hypothetical protein
MNELGEMEKVEDDLLQRSFCAFGNVHVLLLAYFKYYTVQMGISCLWYFTLKLEITIMLQLRFRNFEKKSTITIIKFWTSFFYHIKKITLNHSLLKLSHE